jgi:hypothetical protein
MVGKKNLVSASFLVLVKNFNLICLWEDLGLAGMFVKEETSCDILSV